MRRTEPGIIPAWAETRAGARARRKLQRQVRVARPGRRTERGESQHREWKNHHDFRGIQRQTERLPQRKPGSVGPFLEFTISFQVEATGPGNAAIKVEGKAGPMDAADASLTPLSATVEVEHLDLANSGFVEASSGVAGVVDFKGDVSSDGKQMNSKGTVKANKLKLSATGAPSSVPLSVDYATVYALKTQSGNLNQGDIHIGKALARLNGAYNTAGEPTKVDMKLNAQGMPVSDLEGFLPAVGVVVPSGSKLEGGSLSANLSVSGPVDKLTIAGPVNLSNAKLAGFSLKSKLGACNLFPDGWRRWWFGYGDSNAERQRAERSIGNEN